MRYLIRSASVVSVDPSVGNLPSGDILVVDGKIAAIGVNLEATADEVVDATGHIASPGLVDAHHHLWQAAIRALAADWSLLDYASGIRMQVAALFAAEDMYASCWHAGIECLHAGVTTVADYCHNIITPDHAEEALRGLRESGIRAVWCYGFNSPPLDQPTLPDQQARLSLLQQLAVRHFSSKEDRVTLALAPEEPFFWSGGVPHGARQYRVARDLGLRIFMHANAARHPATRQPTRDAAVVGTAGLLGPDVTLSHMGWSCDDEWQMVADSGAAVAFTPETEMQMGMKLPAIAVAERRAIPFGIGVDIISNNSADLRSALRMALQAERHRMSEVAGESGLEHSGTGLNCARALEWGTMGGARACGLDHKIGSLTPGKCADILLHDGQGLSLVGWDRSNPEGALLLHAGPDSLAAVMVDGVFVKRDFRMAGLSSAQSVMRRTCAHLGAGVERLGGSQGMLPRGRELLAAAMAGPLT